MKTGRVKYCIHFLVIFILIINGTIKLKVALTGAGGFIGSALKEHLIKQKYPVIALSRKLVAIPLPQLVNLLEGTDIVINLAGYPIVSRWTTENRQVIYDSRILTTRKLADAIREMNHPPSLFISGSAVGIYKSTGFHSENSNELSDDFLGKLCHDWEAEALKAGNDTRVVILRTGVVLGKNGGALSRMLPLFRRGLGGIIASGDQGMSWIHLKDVLKVFDFLVANPGISGVVNITAPQAADNRRFTRLLARILKKPAILPIPTFLLKLIYGEGATVLTEGQSAYPEKLLRAGFTFGFGDLETALKDIVGSE